MMYMVQIRVLSLVAKRVSARFPGSLKVTAVSLVSRCTVEDLQKLSKVPDDFPTSFWYRFQEKAWLRSENHLNPGGRCSHCDSCVV